jgi:serine/threonine protein kinase
VIGRARSLSGLINESGRYEVIDEIGRGGMSTVYRARDTGLGREVALKILPEPLLATK